MYNVRNLRSFTTYRSQYQHLRSYLSNPSDSDYNNFASEPCSSRTNVANGDEKSANIEKRFLWGERSGEEVAKAIEEAYKKIVVCKHNLFMLRRATSEKFITLMNEWIIDSPLKNIAFKVIHAILSLLLQK